MIVKLIAFLGACLFVVPIALGVFWLIWHLWLFVLPAIWADGPPNFIHPGYWLFVAMWALIAGIARMFRSEKA